MSRKSWWLDSAAVFALAAVLVLPVFKVEYLNNWQSIEGAFIAEAHALQATWPHHLWQPLWYNGTRADYVYPPGPRYAVAALSAALHVSDARAYHVAIGFCYAFGFAMLYVWIRSATGSRGAAWLAVAGIALTSPSFLLLPDIRNDSPFHVPQRLHVLMTYGEGPHISSLAMLPIAWLGAWKRLMGGSSRWLCLGAAGVALTVTINFYGLIAAAITMPLLVWSCLLARPEGSRIAPMVRDALWMGALAWGLTAWWLVPSYVRITTANLHLFAPPGNSWSVPAAAVLLLVYIAASLGLALRARFRAYTFFTWSGLLWMAIYVLGFRWFGLEVAGSPWRLIPEFDLFAVLCCAQIVGILWRWRPKGFGMAPQAALLIVLFFAFRPSWRYLKHAYQEFPVEHDVTRRVEYKTETWLYEHFPEQRVFVTGTIRFWYNTWHLGQEADGAQQQSILNPLLPGAQWIITHGTDANLMKCWLEALGVDILVVPGRDSQEPYKDFADPTLYDASLPLLRDDGEGNRYYRVPRGATGIVRVVDQARLEAVPAIRVSGLTTQVQAYADAIEAGPAGDRAQCHWIGSEVLQVNAVVGPGEVLLVQETFDPGWHAYENGRALPIHADAVGHMLIALPPGSHAIKMVFEAPAEVVVGRIAGIACLMSIALLTFRRQATQS